MESSPVTTVRPIKPAAPYLGGKRNLAKRLVERIEKVPHRTYAEPFVGMGGVLLRRTTWPQAVVINDWSRDVATFYRILQRHYVPFMDMLRFQITTRVEFERLIAVDPDTLTDLERAARFLYLQRTAFGGKVTGRNFGVSRHRSGRMDVSKLAVILDELHDRLAGVIIERLHFAAFMARYDTADTLFFLDPPYWDCEADYGPELFSKADFEALVEALKALQGRFILTINDVPETRALFADFDVEPVLTSYSVQGGGQPAGELIISGGRA